MTTADRSRLVFHGAIVLFVGLLCGFPAVAGVVVEALQGWHKAHLSIVVLGLWLLATAGIYPSLLLSKRHPNALNCSLFVAGYCLTVANILMAITGMHGFRPTGPAANWAVFSLRVIGGLGALLAVLLTAIGAHSSVKAANKR
jgi:hypothetical protein